MKKISIHNEGVKLISVFALFTLLGVVLYYYGENGKSTGWEVYVAVGSASTIALMVIAFMGFFKYFKEEDKIVIRFVPKDFVPEHTPVTPEGHIETGLYTIRKHCTRSEIQGLLRMILDKTYTQYSLAHFEDTKQDILEQILNVQRGKSDEILIDIHEEECDYFLICRQQHGTDPGRIPERRFK